MSKKTSVIFFVFVAYIVLQFLWWEVLLVSQSNEIISEKQNLAALSSSNDELILNEINALQQQKTKRVYMIVGEGTVFLLILLFGIHQVRKSIRKENELTLQQNNFILSISHELKTPIAASKLQLQTLLKHDLDREKQLQLLTNALKETDRLNKLVEDVLLVSQIENKNIQTKKTILNISELLEQTTARYFSMYLENQWLITSIEKDIIINGDKDLLPSVFINLIENAIKYSTDDLSIKVELKKINNQLLFSVADNGIGILDNEKLKVFQKFYRIGNEETRNTKGTGIGLFIVNQICDAHQAQVNIENNKPNGSVFKILFPLTTNT
jgi:two-component system, OmpR family, phosphate regulon sensor histidine kinase PhoR